MTTIRTSTEESSEKDEAIAELRRTIELLLQQIAELSQEPAEWLPLKRAAHDAGLEYETARKWVKRGYIVARRVGKRWVVSMHSMRTVARLFRR